MRRPLLIIAVLVAAFFGGRAIWRARASDETRIRWLFEGEAEAFNEGQGLYSTGSFAPDWQDETAGINTQSLRSVVMWMWQHRRDPATKRFLHRVELGEMQIAVEGDRAQATVPMALHQGLDKNERKVWELTVTADLARKDGAWRIERTRHETVSGAAPR